MPTSPPRLPAAATMIVADDHPVVVASLDRLLRAEGFAVVGTASNGSDALRLVQELRPDVAVLDLAMPEPSGLAAARSMRGVSPTTRAVLFGAWNERVPVEAACAAGIHGYVLKEASLSEIVRAVRAAASGRRYLDGALAGSAMTDTGRRGRADLTPRERDVLTLLASGLRNEEIGRRLFLSPQTVRAHLTSATRRLGAATRTQAVVLALQRSLIAYPEVPSDGGRRRAVPPIATAVLRVD